MSRRIPCTCGLPSCRLAIRVDLPLRGDTRTALLVYQDGHWAVAPIELDRDGLRQLIRDLEDAEQRLSAPGKEGR